MRVLYTEREDHAVTNALMGIREALEEGATLPDVLADAAHDAEVALHEELAESLRWVQRRIGEHPAALADAFNDAVVVAMVRAGAALGAMDTVLTDLIALRTRGHEYGDWFYRLRHLQDVGHTVVSTDMMAKYRAEPEHASPEALALLRSIDRAWFFRHLAVLTALDDGLRRAGCEATGLEAVLRTATDQLSLESHRTVYAYATRMVENGASLATALRSTGDAIPDAVLRTVELGAQVAHLPHLLAAAAAIAHDLAEAEYCGILQRAVASSDQRTKIVAAADDRA